jgi:hypothetical protein
MARSPLVGFGNKETLGRFNVFLNGRGLTTDDIVVGDKSQIATPPPPPSTPTAPVVDDGTGLSQDDIVLGDKQSQIDQRDIQEGPDPIGEGTPTDPFTPESEELNTESFEDAFVVLRSLLEQYGLGDLFTGLQQLIITESIVPEQVDQWLRTQPDFRDRFPAIARIEEENARRRERNETVPPSQRQALLNPLTPEEYLQYEETVLSEILQPAGLAFLNTPDLIEELLFNNVSAISLQRRINDGFQAVSNAPQEVRDVFAEYFGVEGDRALAAYFVDADRSENFLIEAAATAEIGGVARIQGLGVDLETAADIRSTGADRQRAVQGFRNIAAGSALLREQANEGIDITIDDAASAEFGFGSAAEATRLLQSRLNSRIAAYRGSGGAINTRRGTGLGTAR